MKIAIFVNGCYWHGCETCRWKASKHNTEYWVDKIKRNKARDIEKHAALSLLGYKVMVIWEHEIKQNIDGVASKIIATLTARKSHS